MPLSTEFRLVDDGKTDHAGDPWEGMRETVGSRAAGWPELDVMMWYE